MKKDGVNTISAASSKEWRAWLDENHSVETSVWLIIYHKDSSIPSVYYDEAVDEALCFGWVDSKPNKRDEESYFQYFSKRNPKSNWSRLNKEKVAGLIETGKMAEAGLKMIAIAKENGTWSALEDVENLVIPDDLQKAFNEAPEAFENYKAFPPSSKRIILEWIFNAKRETTRKKRIKETIEMAAQNLRANHYRQ